MTSAAPDFAPRFRPVLLPSLLLAPTGAEIAFGGAHVTKAGENDRRRSLPYVDILGS
jgi:hypothetical protein